VKISKSKTRDVIVRKLSARKSIASVLGVEISAPNSALVTTATT
jgi:hypothetical protein